MFSCSGTQCTTLCSDRSLIVYQTPLRIRTQGGRIRTRAAGFRVISGDHYTTTAHYMVCQASAIARVGPPVIFLQAQQSCAIPSFTPIAFMSLLTQLLHVFVEAPLPTTLVTFILVQFITQSFSSFHSTCPNHLNLALWILFSTHSMPKQLKRLSLCFLSSKDAPGILCIIIFSALPNLARFSSFIAQVSLPYTNTLWTQASYIFPFSFNEAHLFVKTGAGILLEQNTAHTKYSGSCRYKYIKIWTHHTNTQKITLASNRTTYWLQTLSSYI